MDDPGIFNEVTPSANSLIEQAKSLTVKPDNRIWGDPCNKHDPYKSGHHKNLELTYIFRGNKLISEYDDPRTLMITESWEPAKDTHAPKALTTSHIVPRITYLGTSISQSTREDMPLGNQVKITFRNDCGHAISISRSEWSAGPHGIVGEVLGQVIHSEQLSQWSPETHGFDVLHVDPAAVFAVWVGISREYSLADLKNRNSKKILGVISVTVDNGEKVTFEL